MSWTWSVRKGAEEDEKFNSLNDFDFQQISSFT